MHRAGLSCLRACLRRSRRGRAVPCEAGAHMMIEYDRWGLASPATTRERTEYIYMSQGVRRRSAHDVARGKRVVHTKRAREESLKVRLVAPRERKIILEKGLCIAAAPPSFAWALLSDNRWATVTDASRQFHAERSQGAVCADRQGAPGRDGGHTARSGVRACLQSPHAASVRLSDR